MTRHDPQHCPFCGQTLKHLNAMLLHLVHCHATASIEVGPGSQRRRFRIRQQYNPRHRMMFRYVRCLCLDRKSIKSFTLNNLPQEGILLTGSDPPLPETNSFAAHLLYVGGLERHLEQLRHEALMERVAGGKR